MAKFCFFNFKNEFDVILFGFLMIILNYSFKNNNKIVAPRILKDFPDGQLTTKINDYITDNKNNFCNIDSYRSLMQLNVNIIDNKGTYHIIEFIPVCGFYTFFEKEPKIVSGFDF